jgi:hypothetical protein
MPERARQGRSFALIIPDDAATATFITRPAPLFVSLVEKSVHPLKHALGDPAVSGGILSH